MRIAILGAGNVGGALGKGWSRAGHSVAYGVPDAADARHRPTAATAGGVTIASVADAVKGADVIVLAVPSTPSRTRCRPPATWPAVP